MEELLKHTIQILVMVGAGYWVYQDSRKRKVKYSDAWIVGTVLFLPVIVAYLLYREVYSKRHKMSQRQLVELEMRKRAEANQQKIKDTRKAMEEMQKAEMEKNSVTVEEMEKIKAKRLADKAKRLKELAEERELQQEEIAKKMGISRK